MTSRAQRRRAAAQNAVVVAAPLKETQPDQAPLAPWPAVDRYPTIIGSSVTLQYISSVFRIALSGYRTEYVDCLNELIERDPHAFAVITQLIMAVSAARITVEPPEGLPEPQVQRAREIADEVRRSILDIPDLRQSLSALLWAIYYAVSAAEIGWEYDGQRWRISRLYWIHSRRLSYPDPASWGVRIWDSGFLYNWGSARTTQGIGLNPEDYPGKFIIHAPQVRGDYPTRDGLGRQIAYWIAIKLMGARNAGQFIDRFSKPWPVAYYKTSDGDATGQWARDATDPDIIKADAALQALAAGNLAGTVLPDSIKLNLEGPMAKLTGATKLVHNELIDLCNREISEAVLGTHDVIEAGPNGSRGATETRDQSTTDVRIRYHANCLAGTLQRDLVNPMCRLNYPGELHLTPRITLAVDKVPSAEDVMAIAKDAVGINVPVDGNALGKLAGLPLVQHGDQEAVRCVVLKPIAPFEGAHVPEPTPPTEPPANDATDQPSEPAKPGDDATDQKD